MWVNKIMLKIENLHIDVEDKSILKGINLTVMPGEMHAIMGRNGSGKSTLANMIAGKDGYGIIAGDIFYNGESILDWSPEDRALSGIFMSFQYPVVIPGVNNTYFLKAALNAKRKYNGEKELDAAGFLKLIKEKLKRNEILQMLTLEPTLSVLDETDSGLDIDALKIVAAGVNKYRDAKRSFLVITHYQRLLKYIEPDFVHVLIDGQIMKSGEKDLALELEEKGYSWLEA